MAAEPAATPMAAPRDGAAASGTEVAVAVAASGDHAVADREQQFQVLGGLPAQARSPAKKKAVGPEPAA
jgi:hypothetical protein